MKILLVEDSATIRYAMCNYIQAAGHETIIAESGEHALQTLDNTPVDMIIMDVEMPGLDGFETTRLIREWLGDHWIPIIFVTGKSEAASLEEGIAAGGDDYLIKPINQTILHAKIRAMERITEMRNQLAHLNQELTILSQHDSLTQLLNRRAFQDRAEELWCQATRNKKPFTLLLLDIDHFKLFNDCYGHPAGDDCIQKVAAVLLRCMNRSDDVVARYGGEEFIAFLPDTPEAGAVHMCELVRSSVENLGIKHRESSSSAMVTVSIGASVVTYTTGTDLSSQIERADKALYESKAHGRNRATVKQFSPLRKVLIIDEDEHDLEATRCMLEGHCSVITTPHIEEGAMLAAEYTPDLILLDVSNDKGQAALCLELKKNPKTQQIPVILLSRQEGDTLRRFGQHVHANDCLHKPLEKNRLIAHVGQFLG